MFVVRFFLNVFISTSQVGDPVINAVELYKLLHLPQSSTQGINKPVHCGQTTVVCDSSGACQRPGNHPQPDGTAFCQEPPFSRPMNSVLIGCFCLVLQLLAGVRGPCSMERVVMEMNLLTWAWQEPCRSMFKGKVKC